MYVTIFDLTSSKVTDLSLCRMHITGKPKCQSASLDLALVAAFERVSQGSKHHVSIGLAAVAPHQPYT